jgi:hypothetical protein
MKKLLKSIFPAILITVSLFLCFKNYSPGTYLIGWDSLHPEFNFSEAFRRVWEGVWRAEQGVGALTAHSHMADLPRIIFLWLESFILPASFLRYSYIFLCLILGPLGVYFFLKYVFRKEKESAWVRPAAFLGALSYLLNLGTLQNFYVPFEMFTSAFAFLPWLFYFGLRYLREMTRTVLVKFGLVVILSSPMAYASTLWYASFAGLFIFLFVYALISSERKVQIKSFLGLVLIAILLNLYWILPNIYSVINQSGIISNSNINRLFSSEAFLRNRDYGTFSNILLQKNFLFDWRNFDFSVNQFTDLMGVWTKYLSNPIVITVGYVLSSISILGLFWGILKREKTALAFALPLIFCLFFLININPPTGNLYAYLYDNFGIFAEGLRMPFTKFSILYGFVVSFYFAYFAHVFLTLKEPPLKVIIVFAKALKTLFFVSIPVGLVIFMLPAFEGNLIGPNVRVNLPSEYQEMFSWFKSNSEGRIALFPINSKYGWEYRNWAYEGSGFLTYGISNPILYRDFDRWNSANEDFYTQASSALYSNNVQVFTDTLKKYQVKYLLFDESIINPGGTSDIPQIPEFKQVAKFGFLTIYETDFQNADVISVPKYVQTTADMSYSPIDPIYAKYGDYVNYGDNIPQRPSPILPAGSPIITENFSVNRGFTSAYNCDLMKKGIVTKSNSSRGILYRAEGGGASCDYLPYPDLKYNQGYVVRVAGENKEGRSLKIYLFNQDAEVPEIEEILPSGNFDKNYLIYPKEATGSGYILNLETRSFGRIHSENLLTKVEFYSVETPYVQGTTLYIYNNLKVLGVKKYGNWAYKVGLQGDGLLQLGQGFEKGWMAVPTRNFQFSIFNLCTTFGCQSSINVPIFKQELRHVQVNSWSNGWIVPNCQNENSMKIENCKLLSRSVIIVYWPQLLEWGGGVAGLVVLTWLIFRLYLWL